LKRVDYPPNFFGAAPAKTEVPARLRMLKGKRSGEIDLLGRWWATLGLESLTRIRFPHLLRVELH
jgi:hypothetical protein